MTILRKFLSLSRDDRRLIVAAPALLVFVKFCLSVVPFGTLLLFTDRLSSGSLRPRRDFDVSLDRVAWAVCVAAYRIPGPANCLAKALTAKLLLTLEGHPSSLRIGVATGDSGRLEAHAWVESNGEVVIGQNDCENYRPLPQFDGVRH